MNGDRKQPLPPPPKWLQQWLNLPFYQKNCEIHVNRFSTIYCGVCMGEPVCDMCWKEKSKEHENHDQILKVRRASERPAIAVGDMKRFLDVSQIQEYKINRKIILHLRPKLIQTGESKSKSKHEGYPLCETCKTKLIQFSTSTFCSIECKYKNIMSIKMDNRPNTPPKAEGKNTTNDKESKKRKSIEDDIKAEISSDKCKSIEGDIKSEIISSDRTSSEATKKRKIMRKRSRKGIPRRAPLKSSY